MSRGISWLVLGLLCSCHKPAETDKKQPDLPANAVARIGSEIITVEDFQEAMRRRPAGESAAARNALLDELVEFRALVQEAKTRGYDHDPQMIAAFERLLANRVRAEDREARAVKSKVAPAEIDAYYGTHADTFRVPAKIRAAMIFVEAPASFTEEKRAERRATIEEARAKAAADAQTPGFARLAAECSYDQSTKFKGGDLGYLVEGMNDDPGVDGIETPVLTAAFALMEPGQLSDIIVTPQGFYLLKLTERYSATLRPLSTVREQIAATLQREKIKEAEDARAKKIMTNKTIELRRDRLAAIPAPSPDHPVERGEPSAPPPLPDR